MNFSIEVRKNDKVYTVSPSHDGMCHIRHGEDSGIYFISKEVQKIIFEAIDTFYMRYANES